MAMQPRAWMTTYLFSAWISHFIGSIRQFDEISPDSRHLLIVDGHNSHVTLEVAKIAMDVGLDLLTLPSHTSHALQPLDVSIFKPLKQNFHQYRDYWMSRNIDVQATKVTLAQWVSLALRKALTERNIQTGFRKAGIYPINRNAVDHFFATAAVYTNCGTGDLPSEVGQGCRTVGGSSSRPAGSEMNSSGEPSGATPSGEQVNQLRPEAVTETDQPSGEQSPSEPAGSPMRTVGVADCPAQGSAETDDIDTEVDLEREFAEAPRATTSYYFVAVEDSDVGVDEDIAGLEPNDEEPSSITQFLQLPTVTARTSGKRKDPIIEFSKSIIITSCQYMEAAAAVKESKERDKKEKEQARLAREENRKRKAREREEEQARKAVERAEALRQKEERALKRAEEQARKVADREALQRAKATRTYELQLVKVAKAADRARLASERSNTRRCRATETAEGRQTGLNTAATTNLSEVRSGDETFVHPYVSQVHHVPPYIPQATLPPFTQHQLPGQFFFPSSSNVPQFSESSVHPQSMLPQLQNNTNFDVRRFPCYTTYPWTEADRR